jgi:ATP-dependent helicase/DNAse subunit B
MKLYEVNNAIEGIFEQLVDPETGEFLPDECLMEQLSALMLHAREEASRLAQELLDGETAISPVRDGMAACEMCDYQSVCHFDPAAPGAVLREVPKLGMDDLRQLLDEGKKQENKPV